MREAPSVALITALTDLGAQIRAYDPAGMAQARTILPDIAYCEGIYAAAEGAHEGRAASASHAQTQAAGRLGQVEGEPVGLHLQAGGQPPQQPRRRRAQDRQPVRLHVGRSGVVAEGVDDDVRPRHDPERSISA